MRSFNKENRDATYADDIEGALRAYYREQRPAADDEVRRAVAAAAVAEARRARVDAAPARAACPSLSAFVRGASEAASFVAMQARFMGVRAWALQACLVIAVMVLWFAGGGNAASGLYACLAGAAVAVCGLPDMAASRACGIIELERSCKHDARSVAAARMVVLACSNAIGLAAMAGFLAFADPQAGAPVALLCAFAPYCVTVAGCLAAAAAWGAAVMTAAYFLAMKAPVAYEQASVWIWALAAAASAVWAACEARAWLADVAASPRLLSFDSSSINR